MQNLRRLAQIAVSLDRQEWDLLGPAPTRCTFLQRLLLNMETTLLSERSLTAVGYLRRRFNLVKLRRLRSVRLNR